MNVQQAKFIKDLVHHGSPTIKSDFGPTTFFVLITKNGNEYQIKTNTNKLKIIQVGMGPSKTDFKTVAEDVNEHSLNKTIHALN